MKSLILQTKSNEIPNKLFPFFLCQILWSFHSFNVLKQSNPPLQLDAEKNSASWGSLERPIHDNPVFSLRLFSCKTNLLNSACLCKHQHRTLHPECPPCPSCSSTLPPEINNYRHFSGRARCRTTKSFPISTNF